MKYNDLGKAKYALKSLILCMVIANIDYFSLGYYGFRWSLLEISGLIVCANCVFFV